jgi:hypothetical protein
MLDTWALAGGHQTDSPASITYSSVVVRDSVRIIMMIAALNRLDLNSCDIKNVYLMADCCEKILIKAGPEFGLHCRAPRHMAARTQGTIRPEEFRRCISIVPSRTYLQLGIQDIMG